MTIRDIARMAGVSVSTVSRVINNTGYVRKETRERIENLIKENNYRPNAVARSLIRRNMEMIAVVLPGRLNPFFAQILDAVEVRAEQEGQSVLFYNTAEDPEKEYRAIAQAMEHRVQGILLLPVMKSEKRTADLLKQAEETGISVVLMDRDVSKGSFDAVFIDNSQIIYDSVRLFYEAGHRKIGIITCPETLKKGLGKLDGYYRFWQECGLSVKEEYIYHGDFDEKSGYEACEYFFSLPDPPTAVLATCSSETLGCVRYLNEMHIKAGEDVGLIGFDDIALLRMLDYQVTVMDRPMDEMSNLAYDMVMERMRETKRDHSTEKTWNERIRKKILIEVEPLLHGSELFKK